MSDILDDRNGVIITYFSTASAVGKTLLSINMASELARIGYNVCLLDADLQFGDVEYYLGISADYDLADMYYSVFNSSDESIFDYLTEYHYNNVGFKVIPSTKDLALSYNMDPQIIGKVVKILQSRFDFVIIDTTSMFSSLNMILLDMSTIVTFLGIVDFIPTIKNMKIGLETIRSLNYDDNKIRLVLNRSDAKTEIGMHDVENLLGEQFYHILPNDFRAASQSIKTGVPVVLSSADSALSVSLRELVARYTNRNSESMIDDSIIAKQNVLQENNQAPVVKKYEYTDDDYDYERLKAQKKTSGWFSKLFGK